MPIAFVFDSVRIGGNIVSFLQDHNETKSFSLSEHTISMAAVASPLTMHFAVARRGAKCCDFCRLLVIQV